MTDALSIETRSRSRSKTPGILFGENGDSDKKGSKKIPTISLIEEEDDVIEVIPSQEVRPKRQRRSAKAVTLDTSSDVSIESSKNVQKAAVTKTIVTTTSTTTVKETVKKTSNGSEETNEQTSLTATKSSNDEITEGHSIFNNIFNAIKTSTPILSNKRSKRIAQDVNNSTINVAEHPAYKEYREAGEYWNKYPKTDYTYSELSPHRRELSNGVVAMPNMSRRSLEKYQTRVEVMIQNNPTEESFLRRKFLSNQSTSFQKRSADLQYDSTDEVDVSDLRRQLQDRRKPADNVVSRFFLMVVSYIYTGYFNLKQSLRSSFYKTNVRYAYTPARKQKGIFRGGFEAVKNFVLVGFSKVYLLVSTVLCLDTWILYTRSENVVENRKRKRFLLLLILLLPLLLLGGTYVYLDPPQNFSLPKISFPKLNLPKLSLPKIKLPALPSFNFTLPKFSFTLPEISFDWLKLSRPEWLKFPDLSFSWPIISFDWLKFPDLSFSWPEISFDWLKFSRPDWLKFPDLSFSWPEISFDWLKFPDLSFSWPKITLPSMPKFSLPSVNFDISPYTGFVVDKFVAFKDASIDVFDSIREAIVNLLNEAQIVWSENFNAVSNVK